MTVCGSVAIRRGTVAAEKSGEYPHGKGADHHYLDGPVDKELAVADFG
jgi:hypothetical protein